ncbi:MAG: hypothetical protein WBC91_07950 [Phototrophicaceae bacterium]
MQKSWMWADNSSNGVGGAIIDLEEDRVQWFDQPGCACGGSTMQQTIADFREKGSRFLMPPADVMEEMQTFIQLSEVQS